MTPPPRRPRADGSPAERRVAAGPCQDGRPDRVVVWDDRVQVWGGGAFLAGGAPWRLVRLGPRARPFARRLRRAGETGVTPREPLERAVADLLLDRGIAHPRIQRRPAHDVVAIVPAYGRPRLLDRCLASIGPVPTVVIDDGSPDPTAIARVAARRGARVVRHDRNSGPAAARNTGLAVTDAPLVAFLDSDCVASPGWLDGLVGHFDDPRVAIVAPRVRPAADRRSLLSRFEQARSALDMGDRPELVRPGAALGFLPSAAMVVRRDALAGGGFDPALRVGEDVDLVWRLDHGGWLARYEPTVTVWHEPRRRAVDWTRRRYEYGTSAADLERRHPGRLAPARVSGWHVATMALLAARRPGPAALSWTAAVVLLGTRLSRVQAPPPLAVAIAAQGLVADVLAVGHALRREWWPLGWLALLAARHSRFAASATFAMLAPIALEYGRRPPDLDLLRYAALRVVEDAAYGSGVIASTVRGGQSGALLPEVSGPRFGGLVRRLQALVGQLLPAAPRARARMTPAAMTRTAPSTAKTGIPVMPDPPIAPIP